MLSILSQFIFGNSGFLRGQSSGFVSSGWRDKSLCFDLRQCDLELENGEQLIACFFPIEDIKGNPDELGVLEVTNLRLIWICCDKKRVNLSIGWRTVTLAFEQNLKDTLSTPLSSLCILTKYENTKYEFVLNKMPRHTDSYSTNSTGNQELFTHLKSIVRNDKSLLIRYLTPFYLDDPFDVVFKVWQSYKRTNLFRHCRANLSQLVLSDASARTNFTTGEINRLPSEQIIDFYTEVLQCESRSMRYMGTLLLTNIRIIWVDDSLPLRNLSIPYIRVDSIKVKPGEKVVINTHDYLATSNQIELRVQRANGTAEAAHAKKTRLMFDQIQSFYSLYRSKPRFGPESCEDSLVFMSHLRPLEQYLGHQLKLEFSAHLNGNLGAPMDRTFGAETAAMSDDLGPNHVVNANKLATGQASVTEQGLERSENELNRYSATLKSYYKDQPIERDSELVYSKGMNAAF